MSTHQSQQIRHSLTTVYTAAQVRELDRISIDTLGIPGYSLMSRAGQALLQAIQSEWPHSQRLCVLCGAGNNGGDGYIVARLALQAGCFVEVITLCNPDTLQNDAATAYHAYHKAGGTVSRFDPQATLPDCDMLVDALLGTGLDRAVSEPYHEAIQMMNTHTAPVVAVDIPSGLNADTGQAWGIAVQAALTLTFIGLKSGLLTGQARDYVGTLQLDTLEIPDTAFAQLSSPMQALDATSIRAALPPRPRSMHKGQAGHSLLVGGAPSMSGAIRLAGEAALRSGVGLVSIATHSQHAAWLNLNRPELMVHALDNSHTLRHLLQPCDAIAIGPGLGQTPWARQLLTQVLCSDQPKVLDADALNLLAGLASQTNNWILTPHPGEAARLLACTTAEIEQDRVAAVRLIQQRYGGVVVLKGAGTLVADDNRVYFCTAGNPGMASGGMGDVLSGIIAALLAQGLNLTTAACVGVQVHAQAADQAAAQGGERGLLATDLMPFIRQELNT